jgi:hypothetical protein
MLHAHNGAAFACHPSGLIALRILITGHLILAFFFPVFSFENNFWECREKEILNNSNAKI